MVLTLIFGSLAILSLFINLWQFLAACRFPLHKRIPTPSHAPAVTILKPLKGCDSHTRACLESWLTQDYKGSIQILFAVDSAEDPAHAVALEVIAAHPGLPAEVVLCPEKLGPNSKVSKLAQLARRGLAELVLVSDADVKVPPDFLTQAVQPFAKPDTGLVNCFYALANPSTPAMKWEAVAINADFWSQVLQSLALKKMDFALGAVMITRRECLEQIGGFESLVDCLADDYQLGNKVARLGNTIELTPIVVECWSDPMGWRAVWNHQLRWARTIRVCQPAPYFFSILSNATLWPLLWFGVSPNRQTLLAALGCWVVRMGSALVNQHRLTQNWKHLWEDWTVLIKDILQAAIWAGAFFGNEVHWRGTKFKVLPGGKLVPHS